MRLVKTVAFVAAALVNELMEARDEKRLSAPSAAVGQGETLIIMHFGQNRCRIAASWQPNSGPR